MFKRRSFHSRPHHFNGNQQGELTNIVIPWTFIWNPVIYFLIDKEVEWLEGVENEVPHVLVHVGVQNTTIKIIDSATSVHNL